MANTTNLGLAKIAGSDLLSAFVSVFNGNMDKLDEAVARGNVNPIPDTAHDTPTYWRDNIPCGIYYFTEKRLVGQPFTYIWVFSMSIGGDTCQIAMKVGFLQGGSISEKGGIWIRNGTVQGGWLSEWMNISGGGDLLWTNPNTSQPFAGQSVTLDLSNYRFVRVHFLMLTDFGRECVVESRVGVSSTVSGFSSFTSGFLVRDYAPNANRIDFGDCYNAITGGGKNNNGLIPAVIYGIV